VKERRRDIHLREQVDQVNNERRDMYIMGDEEKKISTKKGMLRIGIHTQSAQSEEKRRDRGIERRNNWL